MKSGSGDDDILYQWRLRRRLEQAQNGEPITFPSKVIIVHIEGQPLNDYLYRSPIDLISLQLIFLFLPYRLKYLQYFHLLLLLLLFLHPFNYHHHHHLNEKDNYHQRLIPNLNMPNNPSVLLQYPFVNVPKWAHKHYKYV